MFKKHLLIGLTLALALSFALSSCQPAAPAEEDAAPAEEDAAPAELTTVRVGMMPYLDWQPLIVGDRFGYFEDEGLKLEVTYFPDDVTVGEAVASGDVDIGVGNSASAILLHARFPELVRVGFDATWRGSAIMVRGEDVESGKFKTYQQFYDEFLTTMSSEEAVQAALSATCGQLAGKEIIMDRGTSNAARLGACFPYADINYDDFTVIDMPDPEGALAFLAGTGDFEIGGFPQILAIEDQGGLKMVSGVELGGPSILVSDEFTTQDYLENNYDVVVATRRIWYRVIDDMYENPDEVLPILAEIITEASGTAYTTETIWPEPNNMESIRNQITLWPRLQEVDSFYFDPESRTYWIKPYEASAEYWVNVSGEVKAEEVNLETMDDVVYEICQELLRER